MCKRIFAGILIFVTLANLGVTAANKLENEEYNKSIEVICPYTIDDENSIISRGDCVASIMKIVGVDQKTANKYRYAFYNQPEFEDVDSSDENAGYIILAKYGDVTIGVDKKGIDGINNFSPQRPVTTKECLTFMLRCLKEPIEVMWDDVLTDSVRIGLLQEVEIASYALDELLTMKDFQILLQRMINMDRNLYWPIEEPQSGYAKSMQRDTNGSMKYVDWIQEVVQAAQANQD